MEYSSLISAERPNLNVYHKFVISDVFSFVTNLDLFRVSICRNIFIEIKLKNVEAAHPLDAGIYIFQMYNAKTVWCSYCHVQDTSTSSTPHNSSSEYCWDYLFVTI